MDEPIDHAARGLDSYFVTFTVAQVMQAAREVVVVPEGLKRNRAVLFEYLEKFPPEQRELIRQQALVRRGTKRKSKEVAGGGKRRRFEHENTRGGPGRVEEESDRDHMRPVQQGEDLDMDIVNGPFFAPPSERVQRECIERAIDRTGNAALTKHICMVCARLLFAALVQPMDVNDIPNKRHLVPTKPHPAHVLVNGWLFHPEALAATITFICFECKKQLASNRKPPYALSNGMWIGPTPFELKLLTLPERLLVALYFPAVYIVKLYPKVNGARFWDKRSINSGLRGNVSTYRLNTAQIVDIVSGSPHTMPPSPEILAATIGVTFVGRSNRPLSVLPDFLRVRRQRVFEALVWLKSNNPLYAEITISHQQLSLLPENAVPEEILLNTRYSDDMDALDREHAGYVPTDVADETVPADDVEMNTLGAASGVNPVIEDEEADDDSTGPPEFPLQTNGVIDVHADGVPDSDISAHGFANAASSRVDRSFKIRRDSAFVNEYPRKTIEGERFDGGPGNPNHMLGAFPVLFPYGKGGFEVDREIDVPYENHVRWALQYPDGRFRKDLYFIFQAFGVVQKRAVCRSAGLQIKRSSFIANQVAFLQLRPQDLLQASAEETRRIPITNPVVKKLRKHLTSLRARVCGTDESRMSVRSQIWGMNLRFNPPSIWATINLADTSDPIAQVLSGQQIDLDKFVSTAGPSRDQRGINIMSDPFAAAEFFHYTIRMLLEEVFGIKQGKKGKLTRQTGVVGLVNGYIGTVEAQGRGTLHLHILFWLAGAPTAAGMQAALESEEFRDKLLRYIKQTVRADIKGYDNEGITTMPKQSSVAYSRPVDPRQPNYELRRYDAERQIARAVQFHDCKITTCLVPKRGRHVCKRRAPFTVSSEDWVLPSGEWGPRRVCPRLNSWNPVLLQIIRANQDIKLITNGHETKDIAFYITLYIAKKQIQSTNASALLARSLAFHRKLTAKNRSSLDVNRRMITKCANTLSRQQELSGPEVVSYLMGWGDRFISHNFVPIYWDEITSGLKRTFPDLEKKNTLYRVALAAGRHAPAEATETASEPAIRIQVQNGVFVLKDQLKEYTDRGTELERMTFYDYYVETYHGPPLSAARRDPSDDEGGDPIPIRGRPSSRRVPYMPGSKRKGCRIFRGPAFETVLQFIGTWFPRADVGDYYYACMLALLRPWRQLKDLRRNTFTFEAEFKEMMDTANESTRRVVANVSYYHECSDGSKRKKEIALAPVDTFVDANDFVRRDQELAELEDLQVELTEDDVQAARDNRRAFRDWIYGEHAMNVALDAGIFEEGTLQKGGVERGRASFEDAVTYMKWGKMVANLSKTDRLKPANELEAPPPADNDLDVRLARPLPAVVVEDVDMDAGLRRTVDQQKALDMLNTEQRRAHDIIEAHAKRTLAGLEQEQLLMIVRGEGGTGKTVLLNAISDTFEYLQAADALAKTATTGVAASLVGGQTVHAWAGIRSRERGKKGDSEEGPSKATHATVEKRKRNIVPAKYLDVDECSMLTKKLLAKLSQVVGEVRDAAGIGDSSKPFGGLNVILFGDFHQFPPVADRTGALYCLKPGSSENQLGLEIYRQFNTVVTLTEQKRITDLPWKELLQRLRHGVCTEGDLDTLRGLLVTAPAAVLPEWHETPWCNAVLVTPRHEVRNRWNTASVQKHCRQTGHRMYICEAEDIIGSTGAQLNLEQRVIVAGMSTEATGKLAERVELAVGIRAMVLMNIATEADLANGTRGVIVDFKLDHREPKEETIDSRTGAVLLKYPPAVVFFRPDKCSFDPFEGLPAGVLPIVPVKMTFGIETANGLKHRVHRYQLTMTPGYAFTDYKSQGQTLEHVLIDMEKPPQHGLTPFSAYVALSRSRGRNSIRLLRGFEDELFTTHPSHELAVEDARLDALTEQTKRMTGGGIDQ